ncbi:unnamed protein product [Somion occarium]|uniref:Uncharacterized protein n=2 Tax=Somion occarium TaxID=3059160 RepID=A0ABP1CZN4_9APHY
MLRLMLPIYNQSLVSTEPVDSNEPLLRVPLEDIAFTQEADNVWVCAHRLSLPIVDHRLGLWLEDIPLTFSAMGQINIRKGCFVIPCGDGRFSNLDGDKVRRTASFWLEERQDTPRTHWPDVEAVICSVIRRAESPRDISQLLKVDQETGAMSLQLKWRPGDIVTENIPTVLPFFDVNGNSAVPISSADVPIGQKIRVQFTLHCKRSPTGSDLSNGSLLRKVLGY